jgi:hypothetical protein
MANTVRQQVIVEEGGRIVIHAPELKPGTRAEVIVLQTPNGDSSEAVPPLSSLVGSCSGMFATPEEADQFLRRERDAWDS